MLTDSGKAVRTMVRALAFVLPLTLAAPALAQFFPAPNGSGIPGSGGGSAGTFNDFGSFGFLSCGFLPTAACQIEVDLQVDFDEGGGVTAISLGPLYESEEDEVVLIFRSNPANLPDFGVTPDLITLTDFDEAVTVEIKVHESQVAGGGSNLAFTGGPTGRFNISIPLPFDSDNPITGTIQDIQLEDDGSEVTVNVALTQTNDWLFNLIADINSPAVPVSSKGGGTFCYTVGAMPTAPDPSCPGGLTGVLSVPEPASLGLIGIGLGALGLARRRRARRG